LQRRVEEGWKISAEGYSGFIKKELVNYQKEVWTNLILENIPRQGRLKILDIGTGPGFFAIILSLAGQDVVGIDASAEMIQCAEENARQAGASPKFMIMDNPIQQDLRQLYRLVSPKFMVMDSQELDFAEESFDMIVSRNVVWTLVRPQDAYRDWLRVLKKDGRVLVFDGDWLRDCRGSEFKAQMEKDKAEYTEKYGPPQVSYKDAEKARGWRVKLPLASEVRPEWDLKTLASLGYRNVGSTVISERVYDAPHRLLHRSTPMFMVRGDK
jgi:SAM-dependent methyltransferase